MSEERKKHISVLKNMLEWMEAASKVASKEERKEAVKYAIASLETDEAYQLEYERTTKNDLAVDCISRQATINAVKRIHPVDTDYDCILFDKVDVMYVLNDMPSVTPQEPTIDYRRAFKIACELLSGSVLYGIDSDKIFETAMQKDGFVSNESYERYILNHLQELDHGQYAEVEE